ncbi:tail fiber protein [Bacillus phage Izhevsk]|uniref:DUF4376 domain-containing protein n=1 Tax=Bacillus phage Izhevsk TaxID=2724322 RepID=A0A6H0X6C5_9CAUD|nr:tail fiber protein [Bacillus phage Izhevsk]QIW89880.1 hypothetical protein Izhevsk_199 [Bacillus phage Izhevsk]
MVFDTLTIYEKELILVGLENMTLTNQNALVNAIASKLNCAVWQVSPTQILKYHKDIKFRILDESCDLGIKNGFTSTNGHHYRLNDADQINFLGMAERLSRKPDIITVQWRVEDLENYVEHTRDEWLAVQDEAFDHKFGQLMKYNEKKNKYC